MSTSNITQIISVQKNKVVQIVQNTLTTKQSTTLTTQNTFYAVTAPAVTITATDANSRIILFITLSFCGSNATNNLRYQVLRDSTVIGGGTGGSTANCSFGGTVSGPICTTSSIEYDLPGDTSAHTYSLKVTSDIVSDTLRLNRTNADGNNNLTACTTSNIIAMEILP